MTPDTEDTEIIDTTAAAAPTDTAVTEAITEATAATAPADTPAEDKAFLHTDTPSLLSKEPSDVPAATDIPAAVVSDQPVDPADPAALPAETNYEFKLPDGLTVDESRIASYREVLGKHGVSAEAAQEFLDLYTQEAQQHAQRTFEDQHRAFADTRKGWVNDVMADGELGGAGHQTAMSQIFRMRDLFVPERDSKAFHDFLDATGAGDHPAFLRFMYRVAQKFDEARPAPNPAAPVPVSKAAQRRKLIYDHPESSS